MFKAVSPITSSVEMMTTDTPQLMMELHSEKPTLHWNYCRSKMNLKLPCGVPVIHPPDPVADWQLGLPDTSWYHESVIANIASPGQNQTQNSKHGFCGMCMAFAPSSSQKIVSQTTTSQEPSIGTFHINNFLSTWERLTQAWFFLWPSAPNWYLFNFIVLS